MFSTTDTIVAIATPPGRGGIGVVRLSGPDAHATALRLLARTRALQPRHATLDTICVTAGTMEGDRRKPDAPSDVKGASDFGTIVGSSFSATNVRGSDVTGTAPIDQVVVTHFPAPASYTGDDVVEISAHGSPVVLRGIVEASIERGARLAAPGEFTLRAYLNGRLDLAQAEAVADLVDAVTPLQARTAFDQLQGTLTRVISAIDRTLFDLIARLEASVDFPDEGYHFVDPGAAAAEIDAIVDRADQLLAGARRGRLVRDGLQIAIVGRPNVGKSSLFNALLGAGRAIVAETPGTTRDLVSETIDLEGLRVTLVDTAGLRETDDLVEFEGVARSRRAADVADLILVVIDRSQPFDASGLQFARKSLFVANKADLPPFPDACGESSNAPERIGNVSKPVTVGPVSVSAVTGQGLDELRRRIVQALDIELVDDRPEITNVRHIALVEQAREAMLRARQAALADGQSLPEEFVLADLQDARAALEEIAGKRASGDLLEHIFSRFCVGK